MRNLFILLIVCTVIVLSSCSFGRYLDEKAYVYTEGNSDIVFNSESDKYLDSSNSDEYYLSFMREFEDALSNYNIELLSSYNLKQNNLFICSNKSFEMSENYSIESIYPDSLSMLAETYKITTCRVEFEFDLYSQSLVNKEHLKSVSIFAEDEEKLNTNRTFWQILFGINKDNTTYTYHELSSDVYNDLLRKTARKSAAKISKLISKYQKS